jgi:hypothetical protein
MFSRALLTKLNCLYFLLLKGQSQDTVCLYKILWLPLYDAVVCSTISVLQGTILGIILFLMSINDLPLSTHPKSFLFADDSIGLTSGPSLPIPS